MSQLDQLLEQTESEQDEQSSKPILDKEPQEQHERSPEQGSSSKPGLGSGKSLLADEMTKASFLVKEEASLLSEAEIEAEIDIGLMRAGLRDSIRSSVEEMEYNSLRREALAVRIERNNATLSAVSGNTYLKHCFERQKKTNQRLDKALQAQQEIKNCLPLPYSGMA